MIVIHGKNKILKVRDIQVDIIWFGAIIGIAIICIVVLESCGRMKITAIAIL